MTDPADLRPLRVLLVDPDDRTRESLCGLLGIGDRCAVVGNAGDTAEALTLVRALLPDVLVVDAHADDGSSPAFVASVRALSPATRIVAMSRSGIADADERYAAVDAVVRKTFRPRELIDALVAAGTAPGQASGRPC